MKLDATADTGELRLVKKHPRAIRWMHWINFPLLAIMIWSGLLIYWGDSIPPYQHPHEVYRVGIGHWTLVRFFPDWFWNLLHAPYQITTGLGWHFFVMWLFAVNGVAYAIYLAVSGEWRVLWPKRRSFVDAMWVTLYDLHVPAARRRGLPPQGKYNGAQRIAYSAIVLMGAGALLIGLAIYKPAQLHWLTTAAGRLRDGALGALLADDGLLRLLSRACGAGDSRGVEQLSLDGERGRGAEREKRTACRCRERRADGSHARG